MPDSKITALTALTAADPANDMFPIVDVSDTSMAASGTTKRISINNLLAASGTATLASATITGDLTVRTNKLAVTSTNVGIGTASPTLAAGVGLEIENAGIATLRLQNTSGANAFELQVDSDANGVLYRGYNNSPHVFYVNNSTAMTLNATGLGVGVVPTAGRGALQLSSGINFPATQVASADANTLDDYEEGTWTIGFAFGGASTGITYVQNTGKYTKVGRLVTVFGAIDLSSKGSSTGNAAITGLPFAVGGASSDYSAASLHLVNITFADFPMGFGNPTTTTIPLQEVTNAGVRTNLTDADFANNSSMIFSLTYSV